MLVALLSFRFADAFYFNPALFVTLPFILSILVADRIEYIREGVRKKRLWKNVVILSCFVILMTFCIYRNIKEGFDYNSLFGMIINFIKNK